MKDKANTPQSFIKMEEARRMMDQGQCQESLVLALEALLQELDNLRSSLLALQTDPAGAGEAGPGKSSPWNHWLPAVKPRSCIESRIFFLPAHQCQDFPILESTVPYFWNRRDRNCRAPARIWRGRRPQGEGIYSKRITLEPGAAQPGKFASRAEI
jgi:hypothetical protein